MPSNNSSRDNLRRWRTKERNRGNKHIRSEQESELIKRAICQWSLQSENERRPRTRKELAKQLQVSRQYVDKIIRGLNLHAPIDLLERSGVTPAGVIEWRRREAEYRSVLRAPLSVVPEAIEAIPLAPASEPEEIPLRRSDSPPFNWRYSNGASIFSEPYSLERARAESPKPSRFRFSRW